MGKTEQHVSSTAVATNVCPELQLTANDYVQIREDAEHYYIDVGRSEEMNSMLTAAYERVHDLEDRYSKTLRTILTKLQTGQINAGPDGQEPTPLIMATPSKSRARAKRPAPASSSTNKVILHRAKARNSAEETTATVSASTSGRGRKLFTGKANNNNNKHQVLQESASRMEANLEMMTEMSIDASKASSSKAKKPFIAMEQSALASGQTIADSSTSAVNTTTIRTRSQARLAAAAGGSASKTLASASRPAPMSSTKTSRSRKVAEQQASGSFIRTKDSTSNLRPPALNLTPSKPGTSRLIDLSGGGSVGKKKKPAATTSASSVHNTTPVKQARAPGGGTPSAARRQEMEKNLQEKLVMSEDKRKKADENKKMLLETRAQRLKEDREKRLEKIRMNKAALEQQQQAKVGHEHVVASSSKPLSKQEQRNAERRRKLAEIEAQAKEDKKKPKMTRAAAKKAAAAEAAAASRQQQQQQKQQASDSKSGSKSRLKGTKATTTTVEEKKSATLAIDSEPLPPGPSGLSPIARPSTSAQAGINTRLNETFTTEAVTGSGPIASQDAASTPAHSTFTNGQPQENVTFAVPAIPPPPKTPNSTPNVAKKLIGGQTPTTYEMTPPPRERTADNYDISKYIDSDDEEQQAQHQQQGQKRVPKWAQGRDFLSRIHGQFGKTADELVAIQGRIFPPPPLPVPLEEMGLPVRERYQVRTSSVNWNQARVIEEAVAKLGGHK